MMKAEKVINDKDCGCENIGDLKMVFDYEAGIDTPVFISFNLESSTDVIGALNAVKQHFDNKLTLGKLSVDDGEYRLAVIEDMIFDTLKELSIEIDVVDNCEYFTNISSTDRSFAGALSSLSGDGSPWVIGDIDLIISDDILQLKIETEGINNMPALAQGTINHLADHYNIGVDNDEFKGSELNLYIKPEAILMSSLEKIHKGVDFVNRTSFIK